MGQRRARRACVGGVLLGLVVAVPACSAGETAGPPAEPTLVPTATAPATSVELTGASTLVVNDPDAVGEVGDERLSLTEALQLASGALGDGTLSAAERAQLDGVPGAGSGDEIRFDVDGGRIEVPEQTVPWGFEWEPAPAETGLPRLENNTGDRIVGGGVIIANGPVDGPIGGLALKVSSSDVSVEGVTFERFAQMVSIQPVGAGELTGVTLADNAFLNGGGIDITATAVDGSKSTVSAVTITGNDIFGPPEFGETFPRKIHSAVGGNAALLTASDRAGAATIRGLSLTDNDVRGFQGGFTIAALQSRGGNARGALDGLVIEGNTIAMPEGAGDPAVYIWGAVNMDGHVTDVTVRDVRIAENQIAGNGYVVLVAGVEHLLQGNTRSDSVALDGIELEGNEISAVETCDVGILLAGAFTEMGGGPGEGIAVRDASITGNTAHGCTTGILATPVLNWGTAGVSKSNTIEGLEIRGNRAGGAVHEVVVAGGTLYATDANFFDAGDAGVEQNEIRGLTIQSPSGGQGAVLVAGGLGWGPARGSVTGNAVSVTAVDVPGACTTQEDVSFDSRATVTGNVLNGVGC